MLVCTWEPYVPYKIMIERMTQSTSSSSNMHGVKDDNSNPYKNIVIDAIWMNHSYLYERTKHKCG
jgi:hypothetical protein